MAETGKQLQDLNLLLVDDDQDCREFVAMALEDEGAKVTQVSDAEAAVDILKSQHFDLVTTDKNLPNMDGIGLIRHIREKYGELPIILITGYGSIGSAVDALKFGAQDYLVKPLEDTDFLTRAVRRAVDHHRLSIENRILQEKLQHAKRMESLGILAGGVAHDLNNILEPVVALPGVINDQIDSVWGDPRRKLHEQWGLIKPEDAAAHIHEAKQILQEVKRLTGEVESIKEKLRVMEESGRRAAAVVKDLLAMSESGQYEKKPHDFNEIVRDILGSAEISEMLRRRPGLKVETVLAPAPCRVSGSESHLGRVVANLVRNSIHAMDIRKSKEASAEMRLTLRTSLFQSVKPIMAYEVVQPGEYVMVEVEDTGTGIEKQVMEKMFEPFFTTQAQGSLHGSGLGLSIVHRVIKDHGGFVDVESRVGQGATFRLYLPVSTQPIPAETRKDASPTEKQHVLVVDDEPAARYVAKFLLDKMGCQSTLANNGHEAVKFLQEAKDKGVDRPCDVILLDMIMEQGFDGLTTYENIVKLYPDQKVIVASGYAPEGRAKAVLDRGAGWLPKPYGLQELTAALREQVGKS